MPTGSFSFYTLNSGQVSEDALARVDLAKLRLAGEKQRNILPTVLGPASFRPGLAYRDRTLSDQVPFPIPFVRSASDTAIVMVTTGGIQFMVAGAYISRASVSTAFTNGGFGSDLTGWTDADEAGGVSQWVTGGYMGLHGNGVDFGIRKQTLTVAGGDQNVEHGLNIVVRRGPVALHVGSADDGGDYISEPALQTGSYSFGFTPTGGSVYVRLSANDDVERLVDSIGIEASGRVTLPQPWDANFRMLRYAQSGDVVFIACSGKQQQELWRKAVDSRSWGICEYRVVDGPFRAANTTTTTIAPSATKGTVTLTASRPIFKTGHFTGLFRLTHSSQTYSALFTGTTQVTEAVKVTGVRFNRRFQYTISGLTTTSRVILERSIGTPGAWKQWKEEHNADGAYEREDDLDNEIVYYRLKCSAHNGVDSISATITFGGAIQRGVCRITNVISATQVSAEVISQFGETEATDNWEEGLWSPYRGYPSSVRFWDGRLVWGTLDKVVCSVSDGFNSFDSNFVGDAGPIVRSVTTGPVEGLLWLLDLQRLLTGTASAEVSIRSSSFDEPITPTKFTYRETSTRGSADIAAVKVDSRGIFVQRNQRRIFELVYSVETQDYDSRDLTRVCPAICDGRVRAIAVQRSPETRVWFVLQDGTVAVLLYERDEDVVAWSTVDTQGNVKDVVVLPGDREDEVYFIVERNAGKMCIERMALVSECQGGTLSRNLDSHVVYSGTSTASMTGLDHLEGMNVRVWSNGVPDATTYTVSSGAITLGAATTNAVIGLGYTGQFKSVKLAYAAQQPVSKQKRVISIAPLLKRVSHDGIKIGGSFDALYDLPSTYLGATMSAGAVIDTYDEPPTPFGGAWDADARVCLQVTSPHCATILGFSIDMETGDPHARRDDEA